MVNMSNLVSILSFITKIILILMVFFSFSVLSYCYWLRSDEQICILANIYTLNRTNPRKSLLAALLDAILNFSEKSPVSDLPLRPKNWPTVSSSI